MTSGLASKSNAQSNACAPVELATMPGPGPDEYMARYTAMSSNGEWVFANTRGAYSGSGIPSMVVLAIRHPGTPQQQTYVIAPPNQQPNMGFGISIDCSAEGTCVVIGQVAVSNPSVGRRAYVYRFNGTDWVMEFVTSGITWSLTGHRVAMSRAGDRIAIADPGRPFPPEWTGTGAVDIYRRTAGGWVLEQMITLFYSHPGSSGFGSYIALSGDGKYLGVRSPGPINGQVWMFRRTGQAWTHVGNLTEPVSYSGQGGFGSSIAMDYTGDTVVVGNYGDARMGYHSGAVSIFERNEMKRWELMQQMLLPSTGVQSILGYAVAINDAGDHILSGAPGYGFNFGLHGGYGAVFEYRRGPTDWQQVGLHFAPMTERTLSFGGALEMSPSGDLWLISTSYASLNGDYSGALHLFRAPCSAPVAYCPATPSSSGCVPRLGWQGAPRGGQSSGFDITLSLVPNQRNGLLFYGVSGRNALPWNGGTLCVQPPLRRTPLQASGGSSAPANDCTGSYSLDFNTWISNGADSTLFTGQHVYVQFLTRDPAGAAPLHLSQALDFYIGY
jgi:hypothetical protein